ncbi:FIST signal transduction protein [Peptoniphilus stercorisuis]|uniref:FIST N domain n=1 Tax=Peptoniphilus stercorisuis TaxID=1436965 RepID=A0ABS4KBJ2_9FIRM|nr:FIST N-terminal domain-containing protein [Peptoniphilus stercorisuis]MBP2025153.1 hypothetical protein [Peptoniphilus stercorisuis]
MLRIKTSSSINKDVVTAGKDAANKFKDSLPDMKMAFVYSGAQYEQNKLIQSISKELPNIPLIGNTSFTGVITPEGFISSDDGFVGIMGLIDPDLKVGVAILEGGDSPRDIGRKVAEIAKKSANMTKSPDFFYMVASPGEEEFYLKGITEVIGRVPFFGGSAADNEIAGKWSLFTDELVVSNGVAVAFFYTDSEFTNVFTGAYNETSNVGIITEIKNNRTLVKINDKTAIEQYREWTNATYEDTIGGNLLAYCINKPLGVKDRLGDLVAVRHPMNGNEDGSMDIGNNLAIGTAIIQLESTTDELINSVEDTLIELKNRVNGPIAGLHLVHCGGRKAGIADRIDEVYEKVKNTIGDIPFIVEFTFGEYGYEDDGINTCGGLMLSFTAFGK